MMVVPGRVEHVDHKKTKKKFVQGSGFFWNFNYITSYNFKNTWKIFLYRKWNTSNQATDEPCVHGEKNMRARIKKK